VDMIHKGQWVLLPAHVVLYDPSLHLSHLGVVPQLGRRPWTICDYSFFCVNDETVDMAPAESMQFGRALLCILQSIAHSYPWLGPVFLVKIDVADSFYRIAIQATYVSKLGVIFPMEAGEEPLVALPLVLPLGWKESPSVLTSATEHPHLGECGFRSSPLGCISESDIPLEACPITAPPGTAVPKSASC
jgi:hypothetical protein